MEITNVENPRYTSANTRLIDIDVTTTELGTFPYTVDLDAPAKESHEIYLRDLVASNLSEVAPYQPYIPTLQELYNEKYKAVETARDVAIADPEGTVEAHGYLWQVDPNSIKQLTEALATFTALGGTPEDFEWRDATNVNRTASLAFIAGIAAARAIQVQAIWTHSWELKAELDTALADEDREALETFDSWQLSN